ncbi:uncharacterized protein EV422DRAFT_548327 [Fimicolochytrium jonesii]|uniref:uncharacterized protein n=1 Tax=Fimicolochytrium jonesii TaxID=1396493 RepID=UPI0022FF45C7|nr:uncharacterized protein EV422DRAFT_548327 [Fimicolochytrium jonesii]KAI8815767.1 hypothetical protein EV422DRAFT_548327 [Fimicolochytrium jonesii]
MLSPLRPPTNSDLTMSNTTQLYFPTATATATAIAIATANSSIPKYTRPIYPCTLPDGHECDLLPHDSLTTDRSQWTHGYYCDTRTKTCVPFAGGGGPSHNEAAYLSDPVFWIVYVVLPIIGCVRFLAAVCYGCHRLRQRRQRRLDRESHREQGLDAVHLKA